MLNVILMVLLLVTSIFLILLVLVQRGRGGGLAGAFGGLGGQSAFGTKAGDLFTRITIGVAAFWIILCAVSVKALNENSRSIIDPTLGGRNVAAPERPGAVHPAGDSKAGDAGGSKAAAPAATPPSSTASPPSGNTAPAESK
jgi:preprotein translocase subunit SecG